MNGRPSKTTVDYFPHYTTSGKTLFTLESLYGNDGYAFWFKLLEILGSSENHTFRYENISDWLYLVAKTKVTEEKALAILQTLSDLGAIDHDLYQEKAIWSDNFVLGLLPVYKKRSTDIPEKPATEVVSGEKTPVPGEKTPQSKVKESKVKEVEKDTSRSPEKIKNSFDVLSVRPDWICEQDWQDIIAHRRKHKSKPPETERAYLGIINQLEIAQSAGYSLEQCLDKWLNNSSWQTFKAEYMEGFSKPILVGRTPQKTKRQLEALRLLETL